MIHRSWWRKALCAREPGREFFPEPTAHQRRLGDHGLAWLRAVALCCRCPVQRRCLAEALSGAGIDLLPATYVLARREVLGVWGGTDETDRHGNGPEAVEELLSMARRRAVQMGLVPEWAVDGWWS